MRPLVRGFAYSYGRRVRAEARSHMPGRPEPRFHEASDPRSVTGGPRRRSSSSAERARWESEADFGERMVRNPISLTAPISLWRKFLTVGGDARPFSSIQVEAVRPVRRGAEVGRGPQDPR